MTRPPALHAIGDESPLTDRSPLSPWPLLVFSDDWGRHPSSCQHLVSRLLADRPVVWVNTIGTRPPTLDWATVKRGFEKLRQWTRPGSPKAGTQPHALRPQIISPKMWPSFSGGFARGLNRKLLVRALRPVIENLPSPPVVVTTIPLVADLVGAIPAARWVYYCVDDFGVWPGLDGRTLQNMEAELVCKVDRVVAVSETLQEHIAKLGKPSDLLTHGVDLEHWRKAVPAELPASLREIASAPRPWVVFWGVVDRRMDHEFVRQLGEQMSDGTILLVGPQDNPGEELLRSPRVRTVPPVPYDDLPALASFADALVMPYADLPVTRAMQPLKLKEYLATGRPVIVRDLPATKPWADCLDLAGSASQFAAAVRERLQKGVPAEQSVARNTRLEAEGWDAKAEQFAAWLDG